jgi:flagellar biosynthesis protein FlhA
MVLDPSTGLDSRISNMRNHVATIYGLIMPEIRLTDNSALENGKYVIRIQGVAYASDHLFPDRRLAILTGNFKNSQVGVDVREPVYGAPARWINLEQQEEAAVEGATIVTPTEVLATHLLEVIKSNFSRLLTLKSLRKLLDEFVNLSDLKRSEENLRMLNELVPDKVPVDILLIVLRLLLQERVSIRNLPLILEAIAEVRGVHISPEAICEHVRQRLGFQMVSELKREDGTIPLIQLSPEWEELFHLYQVEGDRGQYDVALPPESFNRLATAVSERLSKVGEDGIFPALVTSTRRRRFLKTVLSAKGIKNPVLSFEEIGIDARPSVVGFVLP